jgi:hypothetical protein
VPIIELDKKKMKKLVFFHLNFVFSGAKTADIQGIVVFSHIQKS